MQGSDKGRHTPQSSLPTTRLDDSRLQLLSQEYHKRIDSLHQEVNRIRMNLNDDELIKTMRKDPTTAQFIPERVKEITENLLIQEQEATIDRLINELATVKGEFKRGEMRDHFEMSESGLPRDTEAFDSPDPRLSIATKELTRARMDLQAEIDTSSQLRSSLSLLQSRLQSTELTLSRANYQLEETEQNRSELSKILQEKSSQCEEMQHQIDSYERQIAELEGKYLAYSGEFKDILTASMGKQSQAHKEKSTLFKQKILKQRDVIKGLEDSQRRMKTDLDSFLSKNKALEDEINALHIAYRQQSSEIQQIHENKEVAISELQLNLQNTMEERLKSVKNQYETQIIAAKEVENQLNEKINANLVDLKENYVKKVIHEQILNTEMEKYRKKMNEEIINLEKDLKNAEKKRINDLKDEFDAEKTRFLSKITDLEGEKTVLNTKKREIERLFEESESRIRDLNSRIAKSSIEIESLTEQKLSLLTRIQENESQLVKTKELYDQEYAIRVKFEVEIGRLKSEISAKSEEMKKVLGEVKGEMSGKIRDLAGQIDNMTTEKEELQREIREMMGKRRELEEEKSSTLMQMSLTSKEKIEGLEKLREQDKQSFLAEFDSFQQTKSQLFSQITSLRNENHRLQLRNKSLLSKLAKDYKSNLRELKQTLVRDLTEFRRVVSNTVMDTVGEVERNRMWMDRERSVILTTSKEMLESEKYAKENLKLSLHQDLQDQSLSYEHKIHTLESALSTLHSQIADKNAQLEDLILKLNAFKSRENELTMKTIEYENELKNAYDGLETWKNASFAVEGKNSELSGKLRDLEEIVEKLKGRNEENLRFFDKEVMELGEKYRITDQRLNEQFTKLVTSQNNQIHQLESALTSLKSTTISSFLSYENDISQLIKSIQTENGRYNSQIQRLQVELMSANGNYQRIQGKMREMIGRLEEVERRKETVEGELKEAREEVVRMQLREMRQERGKTEEMMRETAKDRVK